MEIKKALLRVGLCAILVLCTSFGYAQQPVKDTTQCHTTWDDYYLYLSLKVDCPDVRSKNTAPNADISGDDSIGIYIETNNKRSSKPHSNYFSMTVTPGGGSQFCTGSDDGKIMPVDVKTFKYGSTVQGTINNSDDIDTGYATEIAIPWDILNVKTPELGTMMSFNIIIRKAGSKANDFVSLSPKVKTEEDISNPSKWSNIVFAAFSFVGSTSGGEKVISTRSITRPPLINGLIENAEWPRTSRFVIDMPMPEGFVYEAKFPPHKLVMASYIYSTTDKPLKISPANIAGLQGVQKHKVQLAELVDAGIDVVLPVYRGDVSPAAGYADEGLAQIITAIQELQSEGKQYPMVGMYYDYRPIAIGKESHDFKDATIKNAFYYQIKRFFERVPVDYRAYAQCSKPDAGKQANIVIVNYDIDSEMQQYCADSFYRDFGCRLLFKGINYGQDGLASINDAAVADGQLKDYVRTALVEAISDSSNAKIDSDVYKASWNKAIKDNPHWVFCNGWNDFENGNAICSTKEYGKKFIEATQEYIKSLKGNAEYDAQYVRVNVPDLISSEQIAQAEIEIRNSGSEAWRVSDGYALAYRWYKSGRYFGESKIRRPLECDVLPGDSTKLIIGIATTINGKDPIPDGEYELRFEMVRIADNKWFSLLGDQALIVPVSVGPAPELAVSYISCDAPAMLAAGFSYPVKVQVRNDGSIIWRKGDTKLRCKLTRLNYNDGSLSDANAVAVDAVLGSDCKPGEIAEFDVNLKLLPADKKQPIEIWEKNPDGSCSWAYQLQFDILNGKKLLSDLGNRKYSQSVALYGEDYGAKIADSSVPSQLNPGESCNVKVVLRNNGVINWDKKITSIGYRWYSADGKVLELAGETSQITTDFKPGWASVVDAKVTAPQDKGHYVLVWDVKVEDKWLSALPSARGGAVLPVAVEVTDVKTQPAGVKEQENTAEPKDSDKTGAEQAPEQVEAN